MDVTDLEPKPKEFRRENLLTQSGIWGSIVPFPRNSPEEFCPSNGKIPRLDIAVKDFLVVRKASADPSRWSVRISCIASACRLAPTGAGSRPTGSSITA